MPVADFKHLVIAQASKLLGASFGDDLAVLWMRQRAKDYDGGIEELAGEGRG